MVIFQSFEIWNVDFCSMVIDMYSRFGTKIIEVISDIFSTFPLAFDLFPQKPPCLKKAKNTGICGCSGGAIFPGGAARDKINNFSWTSRGIVFSKKGACIPSLPWKWQLLQKKSNRRPGFKITTLIFCKNIHSRTKFQLNDNVSFSWMYIWSWMYKASLGERICIG